MRGWSTDRVDLNFRLADERRKLLEAVLELAKFERAKALRENQSAEGKALGTDLVPHVSEAALDRYAAWAHSTPAVYDTALLRGGSTEKTELNLELAVERRRLLKVELEFAQLEEHARALRKSQSAVGESRPGFVPHVLETSYLAEPKKLVPESLSDELSSRVGTSKEVVDAEPRADASNNIDVLPVEERAESLSILPTECEGTAEFELEAEVKDAVAATRHVELKDFSDTDLGSEKSFKSDTDAHRQPQDADAGTKFQGVDPDILPLQNILCGGDRATTASSPSSEVVRVSLAAQSCVASHDTTHVPRQDSAVESVKAVSTDVAAPESVACGWSNSDEEQMRGEERRPCGSRKESSAVATDVTRGVTVAFPCTESPARCREDNPLSNIQAFRRHRMALKLGRQLRRLIQMLEESGIMDQALRREFPPCPYCSAKVSFDVPFNSWLFIFLAGCCLSLLTFGVKL
ncbi:hypothetical protein HPB52_022204 [Rhipicephalus sanguineus]|uniref:Uncharacterized protein n=1 Tax=Rhipicephalus sanguineus TaxID=34632 RepID=A0A9D4SS21_RHISA|nr:hypothetical protein HPB52_022204 [Rhipicephalus sanguineus]